MDTERARVQFHPHVAMGSPRSGQRLGGEQLMDELTQTRLLAPGLTTFLNTYMAFCTFRISDRARRSSTKAENRLPTFVGVLWLMCVGVALALLFST